MTLSQSSICSPGQTLLTLQWPFLFKITFVVALWTKTETINFIFHAQALLACLVCVCLPAPLSDGDAESIQAFYGFYGNPIYRLENILEFLWNLFLPSSFFRPYGFGAWGVGSTGFGYNTMVSSPNSLYGGYHYAGWTLKIWTLFYCKL